jgi:hypothetical protein
MVAVLNISDWFVKMRTENRSLASTMPVTPSRRLVNLVNLEVVGWEDWLSSET